MVLITNSYPEHRNVLKTIYLTLFWRKIFSLQFPFNFNKNKLKNSLHLVHFPPVQNNQLSRRKRTAKEKFIILKIVNKLDQLEAVLLLRLPPDLSENIDSHLIEMNTYITRGETEALFYFYADRSFLAA